MFFLENGTIRLRALEPEDLDTLYKWENESDVWSYGSTQAPYSRFTLKKYISESDQDIFLSRQLRLMAVMKEHLTPIGVVDLYDFDYRNLRAGVGILLDTEYRNKGFGRQMLHLIKEYAFNFLLLKQLYAYIPQDNSISMKLFTGCGYQQTGRLNQWLKCKDCYCDVLVLQLINSELID